MKIMTREEATTKHLREYSDGKMCSKRHKPVVRLTKNGRCKVCYEAWLAKRTIEREKQEELAKHKHSYTYQFKMPDGSWEISDEFKTLNAAINSYKRKYKAVYGCEVPDHYFG